MLSFGMPLKRVSIFFLGLLNPLILFNAYMNLNGRDTSPPDYKFVLSLELVWWNYLFPYLLFLPGAFTYEYMISKFLKRKASLLLNYIFSSLFMWVLMYLLVSLRP